MDSALQTEEPRVLPLIKWSFYAFVFSLLYEDVAMGIIEPTLICAAFFLLSTLAQPRVCYRRPHPAVICFGLYLMVAVVGSALFSGERLIAVMIRMVVLTQLLLLCWTSSNIMRSNEVLLGALWSYVAACVSLTLLQLIGAAGTIRDTASTEMDRVTAFGFHPNSIARILGMGALILFGLTQITRKTRLSWLPWVAFALIAQSMVRTGSRGGLIAFGVGFLALAFHGTGAQRVKTMALVLTGIVLVGALSMLADNTRERIEVTLETGSLTRRELIYPAAWQMFLERPWMGWGPVTNTWELGGRLHHPGEPVKDTHNMALYVLTATGLAGALPFFTGVALWVGAAWRARKGPFGVLPMALTVFMLVANTSATGIEQKLMWFVIAFSVAGAGQCVAERRSLPARPPGAPAWAWR